MEQAFVGELIYWRGPAPFYFVAVPVDVADAIAAIASEVTYGWGVIPATITIGATEFDTSLFPKDGGYLVPVKAAVRKAEGIDQGEPVQLTVAISE